MNSPPQVIQELKRDELGRIELLEGPAGRVIRRVATGGRIPGSGWLARRLARRERNALLLLARVPDVARVLELPEYAAARSLAGKTPEKREVLLRSWVDGVPLHEATQLPFNFFDLLDELVLRLHEQGVCHNDLHKEQNILVGRDGYPALLDFQLASAHPNRGGRFRKRSSEDLRHLQKHRRRYTRDGRGPVEQQVGKGIALKRGLLARAWRAWGKPVYNLLVHGLGRKGASEPRRESEAAFPEWGPPLAPREEPI